MGTRNDHRAGRRRVAVAALLPLLLVAGCGPGGSGAAAESEPPKPTPTPVYEVSLGGQLAAVTRATKEAGNAAFTSTLSYGSARGTAVDRSTGTQDYTANTARVERVFKVPRTFPGQAAADMFGSRSGGPAVRETYAIHGSEVDFRTRQGDWLRYSSRGPKELTDLMDGLLQRAGDAAPYGGTLAELVRISREEEQPVKGADGSRTYKLGVPPSTARYGLPISVGNMLVGSTDSHTVDLTVVADDKGRLLKATADYTPVLDVLRKAGMPRAITSVKAEYVLTGHGATKVPAAGDRDGKTEDAAKVLRPLAETKPGACGSTDTGLDDVELIRAVACGAHADLRVFGQLKFKESIEGDDGFAFAEKRSSDLCGRKFGAAPSAWVRDARPTGTYYANGSPTVSIGSNNAEVEGDYTCYVRVSDRG
ncbi:hypothetical protein AB0C52_02390 [Streptomyces sp. NPDC048717]|uniref:hypothetical protein n=1 Tax=Streptomyces sp. NPDC048717 TaxID=3154928 RepID=UPI00341D9261